MADHQVRANQIALIGLLLSLVGIIVGVATPEVRNYFGLGRSKMSDTDPKTKEEDPALSESTPAESNARINPGYALVNNGEVRWSPGLQHPDHAHVLAAEKEGVWKAAPGYWWVKPGNPLDLSVMWVPGIAHSAYEHVIAARKEGDWRPENGYAWADREAQNDLRVVPEDILTEPMGTDMALPPDETTEPMGTDMALPPPEE